MRTYRKKLIIGAFVCLVLSVLLAAFLQRDTYGNLANEGGYVTEDQSKLQTDVDQAKHLFDDKGVPYLDIPGIGKQRHPAWTGLYALEYLEKGEKEKFWNSVNWLFENLKEYNGHHVWFYNFDTTYNDVTIKTPWYSAFGQALGIETLVAAYEESDDRKYLDAAEKAAAILFVPVDEKGLLFQQEHEIWFEEIPVPQSNPTHILNGHMRTLIAIKKLADATQVSAYQNWFDQGVQTLKNWLPKYDTGYWLTYDLNRKKTELLFRFNNPYGYSLTELAIDKITITDPVTGEYSVLDIGSSDDANGDLRISGNDWSQIQELDGRTVRRLNPVEPVNPLTDPEGGMNSPGTYFYLKLPSSWEDNLREEDFVLTITYKDEKAGNLTVQQRSISPGMAFRDMRDGDLLLTGSGQWRDWNIPIRVTDLGYWVGESYGEKHVEYLGALAQYDHELSQWMKRMNGYLNLSTNRADINGNAVKVEPQKLPVQTPMLPVYSIDENGVLRQHISTQNSKLINGSWDGSGEVGPPVYSPFIIAQQAILGSLMFSSDDFKNHPEKYKLDFHKIKKEPAIDWILKNKVILKNDGIVWNYHFDNSYNDVVQKKPWTSSFSQSFIIDALILDGKHSDIIRQAARAYEVPTQEGGLLSTTLEGMSFYEEVPNSTHILNAHLKSIVSLSKAFEITNDPQIAILRDNGINSLKKYLYKYDNGYWSIYDQNPKKETLFQIDWISGQRSPFIESIQIINPETNQSLKIDLGESSAFSGYPRISGIEWGSIESVDGIVGRRFENGYSKRSSSVPGGTAHNAYFTFVLPNNEFDDYFAVPNYLLKIRYKDDAEGKFVIKSQSINEGNFLEFKPIRNGFFNATGDGQWKEVIFEVRPQDLGWYMGSDYQQFHVDQMKELSTQTNDWFFAQYAEKWEHYLNLYLQKKDVIIDTYKNSQQKDIAPEAKVVDHSPVYPGFSVGNALDGDANNNYVAFIEDQLPQSFSLQFDKTEMISAIQITWESDQNFGVEYKVEAIDLAGNITEIKHVSNGNGMVQKLDLPSSINADKVRFTVYKTHGQNRTLLRKIEVFAINNGSKMVEK